MKIGIFAAGDRIGGVRADEDAGLLPGLGRTLHFGLAGGERAVRRHRIRRRRVPAGPPGRDVGRPRRRDQPGDQLVLGGQHHVGGAEHGVRPGGEDPDRAGRRRERDVRAGGPADPVALHQLHRGRPVQVVQILDQPVGVRGDPHHPLLQVALEDRVVAALAAPVGGDLLVGQHRTQSRAPVDRGLAHVGQPVIVHNGASLDVGQVGPGPAVRGRPLARGVGRGQLGDRPGPAHRRVVPGVEDLQEDPLGPAVEVRIGGRHRPARVVGQPQPPQLRRGTARCSPRSSYAGAGRSARRTARPAARTRRSPSRAARCGRPCGGSGRSCRCRCSPAGARRAGRRRTGTGTCPARTASVPRPVGGRGRPSPRSGWGRRRCSSPPSSPATGARSRQPSSRCSGTGECRC